jgi:hypothetical protein
LYEVKMDKNPITSKIIVDAILEKLNSAQLGLLIRSLPTFHETILLDGLNSAPTNRRIALLGFSEVGLSPSAWVARNPETVISWRNDPDFTGKLIVILNPLKQFEKIHSLELLDPFTDEDLRAYIIKFGQKTANAEQNYIAEAVWKYLDESRRSRGDISIISEQLLDFYLAIQSKNLGDVGASLQYLGLLPDSSLRLGNVETNLVKNRELKEWLSDLDIKTWASLSITSVSNGLSPDLIQYHQKIRAYIDSSTIENLAQLDFAAVKRIKEAPKTGKPTTTKLSGKESAEKLSVIQRLKANSQNDLNVRIQYQEKLEKQARQISQMYRIPTNEEESKDKINHSPTQTDQNGGEENFEPIYDVEDGKEIGRAKKYTNQDEDRHILHDWFEDWLQADCWGGEGEVQVQEPEYSIYELFDNDSLLLFSPSTPLAASDNSNLLLLFQKLDSAIKEAGQFSKLHDSLLELDKHRQFLITYRMLFLYYPQFAIMDPDINKRLHLYLQAYDDLAQNLQEVSRSLLESYPDTVQRALAGFLSLDTILMTVTIREKEGFSPERFVLLTCLHPLHLWKWLQLSDYFANTQTVLSAAEQELIVNATSQIPTLLNTFSLHPSMYLSYIEDQKVNLVLSGEVNNPDNQATIGIPYYQTQAQQNSSQDGLKEFASTIHKFLALYPPAQLGLILVLIDPPHPTNVLKELVNLHKNNDNLRNLEAARVYIFRSKSSSSLEWTNQDEEALQLFRTESRWMLSEYPEVLSLSEIHQRLEDEKISPHIVLVCDPSTAVARPTFRTEDDTATPFGIPVHLTYDKISDSVKIVPAPTGGPFNSYANLNNILSGDLHRTVFGIGNRSINPTDLSRFFARSPIIHWLAIMDWPQGTLEMPSNIGRRLLWMPANSRTLSIHSSETDWEKYWRINLKYKLDDWGLSIDPDWVLNRILELTPLLPNGLLELIQDSTSDHANILDEVEFAQLLGVVALLNWYRQKHPHVTLLPIGGDDFQDWYGDTRHKHLLLPFYMALWTEEDSNTLHADIISLETTKSASSRQNLGEDLEKLLAFANSLNDLFNNDTTRFILKPLRRAILRTRLISNVYSPSPASNDDDLARQKGTRAHWASLINGLFSLPRNPNISLTILKVILEDETLEENFEELNISLENRTDNFDAKELILFGGWLQPNRQVYHPINTEIENLKNGDQQNQAPRAETDSISIEQHKKIPFNEESSPKLDLSQVQSPFMNSDWVIDQAKRLRRVLDAYSIPIVNVDTQKSQVGPRFVRYWVQLQPPAGRLSEVQRYAEDIAREMGSRVVPFIDNIPGERYIGIDLERANPQTVLLQPVLDKLPLSRGDQLLVLTGQNVSGHDIFLDLVKYPHLLVAGQTGSGKTIFLSSLILGLAWRHNAQELKIILVDPKQTDFVTFGNLPHLWDRRVIFEPNEAIEVLKSLLEKERPTRVELLRAARCPNNLEYNRRFPDQQLPFIVVVIDEFADLILNLPKRDREDFERQINRLAATGRAIGIHLIIATQRPTTDIITGTIKANIATRISFRLPTGIDSRTILDRSGAENLFGQGDMLLSLEGVIHRLQAYYASSDEYQFLLSKFIR